MQPTMRSHSTLQSCFASSADMLAVMIRNMFLPSARLSAAMFNPASAICSGNACSRLVISLTAPVRERKAPSWATKTGSSIAGWSSLSAGIEASIPADSELQPAIDEPVFVAQLGAFRSRTGAVSEITNLEQAFPEQMAEAGLNIAADRRADGKNMFRIMTASMSAEEAKQLCSVLWDRMVGCMVKPVP